MERRGCGWGSMEVNTLGLSANKDYQHIEAGLKFVQVRKMMWEKCTITCVDTQTVKLIILIRERNIFCIFF